MNSTLTYRQKTPDTNIGGYRYFFNGQEGDNETFGENGLFAFEYRMHDARLGRFWSVDPLAARLLRHATVTITVQVSKTGDVTMHHSLVDTLDLRPNPKRSKEYNRTTKVLGFFYHDLIGGNDKMTVKTSWTSEYPNDNTQQNHIK